MANIKMAEDLSKFKKHLGHILPYNKTNAESYFYVAFSQSKNSHYANHLYFHDVFTCDNRIN